MGEKPPVIDHPFKQQVASSTKEFEQLLEEGPEHGWQALAPQKGVKISQKHIPGTPIGILKGVAFAEGATPIDCFAILSAPDARPKWDALFESGKMVQILDPFNREELSYASSKPVWPTNSRDLFVLVSNTVDPDGTITTVMSSVTDSRFPPVEGKVRAELGVAGWKLVPKENGCEIIHISQSDPKGWVPSSVLQLAAAQIPICAGGVAEYFSQYGPPAYAEKVSGTLLKHNFDHDTSEYKMEFTSEPSKWIPATEIYLSSRRYPHGFEARVTPDTGLEALWDPENHRLHLVFKGQDSTHVRVVLKKATGSTDNFHAIVNGLDIPILSDQTPAQETPVSQPQAQAPVVSPISSDIKDDLAEEITKPIDPSILQEIEKEFQTPKRPKLDEGANKEETPKPKVPPPKVAHRHSKDVEAMVEEFDQLLSEGDDGWFIYDPKKGVKLANKPVPGTPTGYLRGSVVIPDASVYDMLTIVLSGDVRKEWDDLFDGGETLEVLDYNYQTYLLYAATKPYWPTSSRDLVVVQMIDPRPDGSYLITARSVLDPLRGEVEGKVRAFATLAAWAVRPVAGGTEVMYISQSDPRGWVPSSALKAVSNQIPLCVATVRDYYFSHGPPAFPITVAGIQKSVKFNHATSEMNLQFESRPSDWLSATEIYLSPKRYPGGVEVKVTPAQANYHWNDAKKLLLIDATPSKPNTSFAVQVQKGRHHSFQVTVNNQLIFPAQAGESSMMSLIPSTSSLAEPPHEPSHEQPHEQPQGPEPVQATDDIKSLEGLSEPPPKLKHRHSARAEGLGSTFEELANETQGWEFVSNSQGIDIWRKPDGSPTGILRGRGVVEGAKPYEVIAVATTIDTRKHWDALFDNAKLLEVLDPFHRVNLTYGCTKSTLASSSRDLVLCQVVTERPDGTLTNLTGSVEDSKQPEEKGKVRAFSEITAWMFQPTPKGTDVVYLSKSDPKGWLPSSVIKIVAAQVPLTVAGVRDYLIKFGAPPFVVKLAGSTINTTFDHDTSRFALDFQSKHSAFAPATQIFISLKRYPSGVDVVTNPTSDVAKWNFSKEILLFKVPESNSARVTISKRSSGSFTITFNGLQIYPVLEKVPPPRSAPSSSNLPVKPEKKAPAPPKIHRHYAALRNAYVELKRLIDDRDWTYVSTQKEVKIFRKVIENHVMGGYVRGEGIIQDFSPDEVFAAQGVVGCKLKWDSLLEDQILVEGLAPNDELHHVIVKGMLGASKRDMAIALSFEKLEDGTLLSCGLSVEEPLIPPTDAAVRASCPIAGWQIKPVQQPNGLIGSEAVYLSLSDPKGWLPGAVLKIFATQVPLSIAEIESYLKKYGPPPYFVSLGGTLAETIGYNVETGAYQLKYYHDASLEQPTTLHFSKRNHPFGASITVTPGNLKFELLSTLDGISIEAPELADKTLITVKANKKERGPSGFVVNGKQINAIRKSASNGKAEPVKKVEFKKPFETSQVDLIVKEMDSMRKKIALLEAEKLKKGHQELKEYGPGWALLVSFSFLLLGILISAALV